MKRKGNAHFALSEHGQLPGLTVPRPMLLAQKQPVNPQPHALQSSGSKCQRKKHQRKRGAKSRGKRSQWDLKPAVLEPSVLKPAVLKLSVGGQGVGDGLQEKLDPGEVAAHKALLASSKEIQALYHKVVINGKVMEEEFWAMHQQLLEATSDGVQGQRPDTSNALRATVTTTSDEPFDPDAFSMSCARGRPWVRQEGQPTS